MSYHKATKFQYLSDDFTLPISALVVGIRATGLESRFPTFRPISEKIVSEKSYACNPNVDVSLDATHFYIVQ